MAGKLDESTGYLRTACYLYSIKSQGGNQLSVLASIGKVSGKIDIEIVKNDTPSGSVLLSKPRSDDTDLVCGHETRQKGQSEAKK